VGFFSFRYLITQALEVQQVIVPLSATEQKCLDGGELADGRPATWRQHWGGGWPVTWKVLGWVAAADSAGWAAAAVLGLGVFNLGGSGVFPRGLSIHTCKQSRMRIIS
jgi:hypothetical protein